MFDVLFPLVKRENAGKWCGLRTTGRQSLRRARNDLIKPADHTWWFHTVGLDRSGALVQLMSNSREFFLHLREFEAVHVRACTAWAQCSMGSMVWH